MVYDGVLVGTGKQKVMFCLVLSLSSCNQLHCIQSTTTVNVNNCRKQIGSLNTHGCFLMYLFYKFIKFLWFCNSIFERPFPINPCVQKIVFDFPNFCSTQKTILHFVSTCVANICKLCTPLVIFCTAG